MSIPSFSFHETQFQIQSGIGDSAMIDAVTETQVGDTAKAQELASLKDVKNCSRFYYELCYLKRVLKEELGDDVCCEYNVLVVAVHAVFLESGFVGFDSELGLRNDRLYIMEEPTSSKQPKVFTMSLCYTLPQLLDNENVADSIVLKFQSLGHFLNVYGTLANGGSEFYRVCLDEYMIAPIVNSLRLNRSWKDGWCCEKGIYEFQRIVKDELVLPLLTDLCHKTGLVLRSCFTSLPMELKSKILESLPGVDIARMECVSAEMRQALSSNNDLWKQKFVEEFHVGEGTKGVINWKQRFASYWERKRRKRILVPQLNLDRIRRPRYIPIDMYPRRQRFPIFFRYAT